MLISGIKPYGIYNNAVAYNKNNATRPVELKCDTVSFGNTKTDNNFETFMDTVEYGDAEEIKSILASKDNETKKHILLQTDKDGDSALICATKNKDAETAEVLLNSADLITKIKMLLQNDKYGHDAIELSGSDRVREVLTENADKIMTTLTSGYAKKAEKVPASKDNETKKHILLQTDKDGDSALMDAAANEDAETAEVLRNALKQIDQE